MRMLLLNVLMLSATLAWCQQMPGVVANLTLHGRTQIITVQVQREKEGYKGLAKILQTQFGICPVSAAGGAMTVKDELRIEFIIIAKE